MEKNKLFYIIYLINFDKGLDICINFIFKQGREANEL